MRDRLYLAARAAARHSPDRLPCRRHRGVRVEPVGVPARNPRTGPLSLLHRQDFLADRPRQSQPAQLHRVPGPDRAAADGVARRHRHVQPRLPADDRADRLRHLPAGAARHRPRTRRRGSRGCCSPGARCSSRAAPRTSAWSPPRRCRSSCCCCCEPPSGSGSATPWRSAPRSRGRRRSTPTTPSTASSSRRSSWSAAC